jgi:hypothetical protein
LFKHGVKELGLQPENDLGVTEGRWVVTGDTLLRIHIGMFVENVLSRNLL